MAQAQPIPVAEPEPLLRMRGITRRFAGVIALQDVDFDLRAGEVHAVCGENGAGKSTLMKILSGQLAPDDGSVELRGHPVHFMSCREAERAGIAMIHQELNLVPHLSVAENILLAREPHRLGFIDRRQLRESARRHLDRLKVDIDPAAIVRTLSVAHRQMVEIAKALSLQADVLIMDEPTSSLTEAETARLFEVIADLRRSGVGVAYISHRLDELEKVVDRVTVLRDGRRVATSAWSDTSIDRIVEQMVGRSLTEKFPPATREVTTDVLLRVSGLTRRGAFDDVTFDVRRGEILGFAGLMGAGRTEVARAVFGADPKDAGETRLNGELIRIDLPRDAIRQGIAYLSEDRKAHGVAVHMRVDANITMANMRAISNRFGFIRFPQEEAVAREYIELLGIRTPSARQLVRLLSGGNQQKVVIAKWLFKEARVLFFDEPTRGIDVGARFAIYELLDRLAAKGIGIVVISSDLPEILGIADRIAVFHRGRIAGEVRAATTTQEEVMRLASGFGSQNRAELVQ